MKARIAYIVSAVVLFLVTVWGGSYLSTLLPDWTRVPLNTTGIVLIIISFALFFYSLPE